MLPICQAIFVSDLYQKLALTVASGCIDYYSKCIDWWFIKSTVMILREDDDEAARRLGAATRRRTTKLLNKVVSPAIQPNYLGVSIIYLICLLIHIL